MYVPGLSVSYSKLILGQKVLAVLGCCEQKVGSHRWKVNDSVDERTKKIRDDRNREIVEKWMDSLEFRPPDYLHSGGPTGYRLGGYD